MSDKWEITMQFGQEPGNQVRVFVVEAANEMQARKQAAKDWPVKGTIITKVKKLNAAYQNGVDKANEYINQRMGNVDRRPKAWQRDPDKLTTSKVQWWVRGVMRSVIPLEEAKRRVKAGTSFVISDQAIGHLDENGNYDS